MTVVVAMMALIRLGAAERLDPRELPGLALAIANACEAQAPTLPPHGDECVRVVATLWAIETAGTFALHPGSRYGCGPLQVNPVRKRTPPCGVLHWSERDRWAWGVRIFRIKFRDAGRMKAAFRDYNGHPTYRNGYAVRALQLLRKTGESNE